MPEPTSAVTPDPANKANAVKFLRRGKIMLSVLVRNK